MNKLPRVTGKEMCRLLEKIGFERIGQKGSHVRYRHTDGRRTVVPVHGNSELGPGLIGEILNQIHLDKEEFKRLVDDL